MSEDAFEQTPKGRFPATRWSQVLTMQKGESEERDAALNAFCETYWYPIYRYARCRGKSHEDAEDLTQGFFQRLLASERMDCVSPEKGKLRTYLLNGFKHYMINEWRRGQAKRRGSGRRPVSLDINDEEQRRPVPVSPDMNPEQEFDRQWALSLLDQVTALLAQEYERSGRQTIFASLKRFLYAKPESGYSALEAQLDMTTNTIKVTVHRMRSRFRALLRQELVETLASPEEADAELAYLRELIT